MLCRARAGDRGAFEALYRRYAAHVEMICRSRLAPEDARDAVQDTFERAWRAIARFEGEDLFSHWLGRIARNVAIDAGRRSRRRPEVPLEDAAAQVQLRREGWGDDAVQGLAVRSLLRTLSRRDAALLVSHHVQGFSVRELAAGWGLTERSMAVALQRARDRARRLGEREGLAVLVFLAAVRFARGVRARCKDIPSGAPAVAFASQAAVALILLAPAIPPVLEGAMPPDTESAETRRGEFQRSDRLREGRRPGPRPAEGRGGAATDADRSARATRAAAAPPDRKTTRRPAVVEFEPVEVPGTGRTLSPRRPAGEADYAFTVRGGPRDDEVKVEAFDEPQAEPVHEAACDVARSSPALTSCERAGERPGSSATP